MNIRFLTLLLGLSCTAVFAQQKESSDDIYKFSVEQDILNLEFEGDAKVYLKSATGFTEDITKTAYLAFVITKEEIEQTGAITIPEALRLAPSLLVKQKTNGLYDVSFYGTTVTNEQTGLSKLNSKRALVMVNNMPVTDYFTGNVFWETLPTTLADIEKIEVVASPSGVMYGRDAYAGTINIITKNPESNSLEVNADVQGGNHETLIGNTAVSFGVRDKVMVRLSGKYIGTRRFQDEYYVTSEARFIPSDSLLFYQSNAQLTNLYGSLARDEKAANAYLRFNPADDINVDLSLSAQNSEAQDIYTNIDQFTLTRRNQTSYAANVNADVKKFTLQSSLSMADQNLAVGYTGYETTVSKINSRLFYTQKLKSLAIMPGVRYQSASFDDTDYVTEGTNSGIVNGSQAITNYGAFLKTNASLLDNKISFDGGLSYDIYENENVLNYQVAATYQPFKKVMVRASYSTGNLGANVIENYNTAIYQVDSISIINTINNDLVLTKSVNYNAGIRANVTDKILVEADYFVAENSDLLNYQTSTDGAGNITIQPANSGMEVTRSGLITNITAKVSGKFRVHAFATIQSTDISGNTAGEYSTSPKYFGGLTANFNTLLDKLNISASAYAFGEHQMISNLGRRTIESKIIPALKVSYKVWEENKLFINVRNPLSDSKEYIFADDIPAMYLIGTSIKF